MTQTHIVKSFDEELGTLKRMIKEMGSLVAQQLSLAAQAIIGRNDDIAQKVVEGDPKIDEFENTIDNFAVRLLALRQPVASDLRAVVAALKISSHLERIADYAVNVAKRAMTLNKSERLDPIRRIPRMIEMIQGMMHDVLEAYSEQDVKKATLVWNRDNEVDQMYNGLLREVLTYMMENPSTITPGINLLFVGKHIERMGDHTTNIAENIHFIVHGKSFSGERPKSVDPNN